MLSQVFLSVTEGAKRLGVGRQTLSNLVNEKASLSIEMAYRLRKSWDSILFSLHRLHANALGI
ncbi:MAG: helix-turn-helix domain-containing protein [Proteobacteria bacterium]|nr:helix-turn-helix domain-containing protein [Pseudomonadota bacterium]